MYRAFVRFDRSALIVVLIGAMLGACSSTPQTNTRPTQSSTTHPEALQGARTKDKSIGLKQHVQDGFKSDEHVDVATFSDINEYEHPGRLLLKRQLDVLNSIGSHSGGSVYFSKPRAVLLNDYKAENSAQDLYRTKKYKEALAIYDKLLARSPQNSGFYTSRGHIREAAGEFEGAKNDFLEAQKLDPSSEFGLSVFSLSDCYVKLHQIDKAIALVDKLLQFEPLNYFYWFKRADLEKLAGDSVAAHKDKNHATQIRILKEAARLASRGNIQAALALIERGTALGVNQDLLIERGDLYLIADQTEPAAEIFSTLPKSPQSLHHLAVAHEMSSKLDDAVRVYTQALSMIPEEKDLDSISNDERFAQSHNQNYFKELPNGEWKIRMVPAYMQRAEIYHDRARALVKQQKYKDAIVDCTKALKLKENPVTYSMRGDAYAGDNQNELALKDFEAALRERKDSEHALLTAAQLSEKLGQTDKAIGFYTRLIALHPTISDFLISRSALYKKLEKFDDAKHDLQAALQIEPGDEVAQAALKELGTSSAKAKGASSSSANN